MLLVRLGHREWQKGCRAGVVSSSCFNLFRVCVQTGRVFDIEHPPCVELSINQNGGSLGAASDAPHGLPCA